MQNQKNMAQNRITSLFHIQYPIIRGGMAWCSGWRLASAVSNAGGLGLIGAGSMHPGAEGVQIGTRFALTTESSANEAFKKRCLALNEGETISLFILFR